MNLPVIIVILALTAFVAFVLWRKYEKNKIRLWHGVPIPRDFPYKRQTLAGATVKSVVPVPSFVLKWIDEGISEMVISVWGAKPDWQNFLQHRDYTVLLIEPMSFYSGSNPTIQGAPQITVNDGRNASAMNLGTGNDGYNGKVMVIPHQTGQDWRFVDYFRKSVRYEAEHIVIWMNDEQMFWRYTGQNDIHPIFP